MRPGQHEGRTGPLYEPHHFPQSLDHKKAVAEFDRLWESCSGCRNRERMCQLLQVINAVEARLAGPAKNDLFHDAWAWLAPLPETRHHLGFSAAKARLYELGGFVGPFPHWQTQSMMFVYDHAADSWNGGVDLHGASGENSWETRVPLLQAQAGFAATSSNEQLVLFGIGQRAMENKVVKNRWVYDLQADRWRALPPLAMAPQRIGASTVGNRTRVRWRYEDRQQYLDRNSRSAAPGVQEVHDINPIF